MFYHWEQATPDKVFLRQPSDLIWTEYTWAEVADRVRRIAGFILSKNYPAGSRIAIWAANSKDWVIVDLAIMLSGHISVPIYPGQDIESARYIFGHSDARLLFAGVFDQADSMQDALVEGMETVAMSGCDAICDSTLKTVIADNAPYTQSPVPNPEDVFTFIYTSGTTGNPKGVMHMHQTPGHVVPGLVDGFKLQEEDSKLFSFLPMAHAAERIAVEMTAIYSNTVISFSQGLATFGEEIRSVQPTFFFAVPRLWVKFKEGVDAQIPPEMQAQLTSGQKAAIKHQLGLAEARIVLTGSAPCPKIVQEWFFDKGIVLRDGYGMTENFVHGVAWFRDDLFKAGCVGQPMTPEVEVRVSDSGEIQFRSKGLMKGYYKNPEKTAEVIQGGWYCTGDSGKIDKDGDLWVTGRVSEVFKTSRGKFIVPTRIEDEFGRVTELAQYCALGHGLDQPVLLATLSETGAALDEAALASRLGTQLAEVNDNLNSWERVRQIYVVPEWTIENALLTPTMKLRRKQIEDRYRAQIERNLGSEAVVILQ
ncbi:MAG: AMP-binding protein [Gammaproteobacteria bacterium]|nr:AMP-binding protein [Gammaproteobacteria bacterium]